MNEHVEVAGEGILKRSTLIEFCHKHFYIGAVFDVNRKLKTVDVGFVSNVLNLLE